jgi:hypothetical protein
MRTRGVYAATAKRVHVAFSVQQLLVGPVTRPPDWSGDPRPRIHRAHKFAVSEVASFFGGAIGIHGFNGRAKSASVENLRDLRK